MDRNEADAPDQSEQAGSIEQPSTGLLPVEAANLATEEPCAQEILDLYVSSNRVTEQQVWDRLIAVLYEARDLDGEWFNDQVDPLNETEVLLDVAKLPPRPMLLNLLWNDPGLDLKGLLQEKPDPLEYLQYLHLLVAPLLPVSDWGDEDREPPASTAPAPPLAEYGLSLVEAGVYSFKRWSAAMLERFPEDADAIRARLRDIHDEVMEQFEERERPFYEQAAASAPVPAGSPGPTPLTEAGHRLAIRAEGLRGADEDMRSAEEELRALGLYHLAERPPESAN